MQSFLEELSLKLTDGYDSITKPIIRIMLIIKKMDHINALFKMLAFLQVDRMIQYEFN